MRFVSFHVVHPSSSIDTATTWKKSHFISSEISDFNRIDNLSISVHPFDRRMLTSVYVDKIWLQKYWRDKNELTSKILLWNPTEERVSVGRPPMAYIDQLSANAGYCLEKLLEAMDDKGKWCVREREREKEREREREGQRNFRGQCDLMYK